MIYTATATERASYFRNIGGGHSTFKQITEGDAEMIGWFIAGLVVGLGIGAVVIVILALRLEEGLRWPGW